MTVTLKQDRAAMQALLDAPTSTRRSYPHGGFEGLEANAVQILIALILRPDRAASELAEELALSAGTVRYALSKLAAAGFVKESIAADDRRRHPQRVTSTGRALTRRFLAVDDYAAGAIRPGLR